MERGDAARKRVEALALIELAVPLEERFGPAAWALSLRDNWTMFVPMGHPLLSGLSGTRRIDVEAARGVAAVRRTDTTAPQTAREARAAATFERNTRSALRKHGKPVVAAGGAALDVGAMEVRGLGLEAHLRAMITREVSADEVLRALARTQPEAAAALADACAVRGALAAAAAAIEAEAAAAAAAPPPPPCGPALELSPQMLSFRGTAPAPESTPDAETTPEAVRGSRGVLTLRNSGSTALFYRWVLADTTGDAAAPPQFVPLAHAGPRPGVLLPGETRAAAFRYAPSRAGAVTELWALQCAPDLAKGPGEAVPMVMLQGTARECADVRAAAKAAKAAAKLAAKEAATADQAAAAGDALPAGARPGSAAVRASPVAPLAPRPATAGGRPASADATAEKRRRLRAAAEAFDVRMAAAERLLRAGALGRAAPAKKAAAGAPARRKPGAAAPAAAAPAAAAKAAAKRLGSAPVAARKA
jgi:hypothetical protein